MPARKETPEQRAFRLGIERPAPKRGETRPPTEAEMLVRQSEALRNELVGQCQTEREELERLRERKLVAQADLAKVERDLEQGRRELAASLERVSPIDAGTLEEVMDARLKRLLADCDDPRDAIKTLEVATKWLAVKKELGTDLEAWGSRLRGGTATSP